MKARRHLMGGELGDGPVETVPRCNDDTAKRACRLAEPYPLQVTRAGLPSVGPAIR
jgi:hypothetical protein